MYQMKKNIAVLLFSLLPAALAAGEIWVSPAGSDKAAGTKEQPLQSLRQALQTARDWRRTHDRRVQGGIAIIMRGGTYCLQEPVFVRPDDSGTEESPTVIRSAEGERAVLSGGKPAAAGVIAPYPTMQRILAIDREAETITIPAAAVEGCSPEGLAMVVHQRWAIAILRVDRWQTEDGRAIVSFRQPESALEFRHPYPQPVIGGEKGNSSFCLIRLEKSELLNRLLTIEGTAGYPVSNVVIDGIAFENAAWKRPAEQGHVTLQGGFPIVDAYQMQQPGTRWSTTLENQAWIERPEAAVSVKWATGVCFYNCEFKQLAATALDFCIGVKRSAVSGCSFSDIGGTAVMAGSFQESPVETHVPYDPVNPQEYVDGLDISNNVIRRATMRDYGAAGIQCGYVRNTVISKNRVDSVNWSGICLGWGWTPLDTGMERNAIIDNQVSHYALNMHDSGAIYTLSNQPGSVISGNEVSAPGEAPYATNDRVFPLYLDDSSDGFTISGKNFGRQDAGTNRPGPQIVFK